LLFIFIVTYCGAQKCLWLMDATAPAILVISGGTAIVASFVIELDDVERRLLGQHPSYIYFLMLLICTSDHTKNILSRVTYLLITRVVVMQDPSQIAIMGVLALIAEVPTYYTFQAQTELFCLKR